MLLNVNVARQTLTCTSEEDSRILYRTSLQDFSTGLLYRTSLQDCTVRYSKMYQKYTAFGAKDLLIP